MKIESGVRLGPYQIEEAVGAGGMGEVYRANDTRLDRSVAIKILPSHLSSSPDLKQRFEREAKTISSLQHPNICSLFDVGHESGVDFLVMEYLEGQTLAERLREGPLPTNEVLRIGVQITEALEAAHRRGVIHRDLKPGNIMLTKAGVKLLDFGLAKTARAGETTESSITKLATEQHSGEPLTEKGTVLGTFQYMAPEQLEGGEADKRTDIFALGAVLYEMAAGARAFDGKSQASLIASIMSSEPQPISAVQPMTPPALDRVIRTCLAKDPDDRWQTAHDVALQLKWIEEGGSQAGIPKPVATRRRSRERTAWAITGVAVIAAALLGVLTLMRPAPPPAAPMRFNIEAPPGIISFGSPRISPDGRHIVFDGIDSTGTTMLWLRPLNSLAMRPLPGTEGCSRPTWSPDSRHVAFFASSKLKRVPITGGPPLTLCDFPRGADGTWGAAGMILFDGQMGDSIQGVPAGGGPVQPISRIDRAAGQQAHGWPHFLPDGERFLFIAFHGDQPDEIRLGKLGSFDSVKLTDGDSRIEYVAPGYLIFERSSTLLAQPFDADAGTLTGDPFPLAEGIGTGGVGLAHFSGSDDGTLIFTAGDPVERQLVWIDRLGREISAFADPGEYWNPALSPDGRRVAVSVIDPRVENGDIWIVDFERGVKSRFTFDAADDDIPVWSPDGSQIAFGSDRDGNTDIYVKNAAGTGDARKIWDGPLGAGPQSWSRDGANLLSAGQGEDTGWDVFMLDRETGWRDSTLIRSRFHEFHPQLSPDGKCVAYVSLESGRWDVYLTTFPRMEGKWQVSLQGGSEPYWRGDSKELYFVALDRTLMAVDVQTEPSVEIGVPRRLFRAPIPRSIVTRNRYYPAADGQKFLMLALLDRGRVPPTTVVLNWTAELSER